MSKLKKILVVFVACMGISTVALGSSVNNWGQKDDVIIPLDGGVSILIAAGVAYGAKKYRDFRKNKKECSAE